VDKGSISRETLPFQLPEALGAIKSCTTSDLWAEDPETISPASLSHHPWGNPGIFLAV